MRTRASIACGLAALSLAVAGCGEEEIESGGGGEEKAAEEAPSPSADHNREQEGAAGVGKPKVTIPEGAPPKELQKKDLKKGSGATATAGKQISVNYVGVAYSNGQEFDNSYDRGVPVDFQLGTGMVIPGWDQGIEGMKVGGRRRLVIPPDLAYGQQGDPPTIAGGETLVFVIDLLAVQ
jgi:peptidylprolyl isomerase